ncbi:MAG TPA: hypothetical protein VEK08_19380 [Planctomycetota bacterium]|nr:hypothetical protein [Planctomycetota bacterium]
MLTHRIAASLMLSTVFSVAAQETEPRRAVRVERSRPVYVSNARRADPRAEIVDVPPIVYSSEIVVVAPRTRGAAPDYTPPRTAGERAASTGLNVVPMLPF